MSGSGISESACFLTKKSDTRLSRESRARKPENSTTAASTAASANRLRGSPRMRFAPTRPRPAISSSTCTTKASDMVSSARGEHFGKRVEQVHRGVDLVAVDRDAFHVDAERHLAE